MLTSLQNPLVKQIRKLHQAKGRREQALFLLEGTHLLEEACAVNYPLSVVCATPNWIERHPDLWQSVQAKCDRAEVVSEEVLKAIATTINPDGAITTAKRLQSPSLQPQNLSLGLALETLQDPGNLGTMIRTAAAAGADGLWLSADSVDVDHPKVLRASAGQWFRLPIAVSSNLRQTLQDCRNQKIQIVATIPQATMTHWQVNWRQPTLILLGNEGAGLSSELVEKADVRVKIPLSQGVESLNVAIAAAVILYEAQRQRQETV